MDGDGSTMTARQLAQGLYNSLAAQPQFGGQPFEPSRLGNMRWMQDRYGVSGFKSRDQQWDQGGQTWPDDSPNWLILNKQYGGIMNRISRQTSNGIFKSLANPAKAERWGRALFTMGHELGHNFTSDPVNYNEPSADYWGKTHFKEYGRDMGLNRQQIGRMWRANNKFAGVKTAPQ